ncbi:MAG: Precorrin-3B C(17)-methyltransferase [Pseudomonadota bacterium]
MSGYVRVVGLGPGPERWLTPEVSAALAEASDLIGYKPYVERLTVHSQQTLHASDNGDELQRARTGLALAQTGARVVIVSGGDPGVFAMAAAVFEAIEHGPPAWRGLDVSVLPGVTAMLAAAARLGAPLGNDFCAINLSDNLKPWSVIEKRLRLAAEADFVIALYNPRSKARPDQLARAFDILRVRRAAAADIWVAFAKAIGRAQEAVHITTLAAADPLLVDMQTLVLIGASGTRYLERPDGGAWLYSPRRIAEVS